MHCGTYQVADRTLECGYLLHPTTHMHSSMCILHHRPSPDPILYLALEN